MRDELYINGVKVDLGKTNISLNYKSNLLSDISKIVSNNSYTIKLPKTSKNLALIECVHIPSSVSRVPYLKHTGTLVRNGIEIVKDASVVLLSVGDSIEVALSWGNVTGFANIVNNGKKLTDLSYGTTEGADWIVWKDWSANSERFPRVNYGFNDGDPNVWYHPVVTTKWVLDKIIADNNTSIDIPEDKMGVIDKMIVPLTSKNDSQALYDKYPIGIAEDGVSYASPIYPIAFIQAVGLNMKFNGDDSQSKFGEISSYYYAEESYQLTTRGYKFVYNSEVVKIKGSIALSFTTRTTPENYIYLQIRLDGTVIDYLKPTTFQVNGNQGTVSFSVNHSFAVEEGQTLTFVFSVGEVLVDVITFPFNKINIYISKRGELYLGEKFPFVPNLPDIKQIDFIKAITSMLGLFAIPNGTGGIKFISFDDLKTNVSRSVDWTGKLLEAYNDKTPRDIKYTLNDVAQNNRFKYKEEDAVKGNYDGNINIDDVTLDFERDAITLPFSACDTNNGVASIPVYSHDGSGKLQYKKVNPRILLIDGTNGVFKGLDWGTLISNYYQTYKGLINEAKIITEYIRLNSVELRDLEMDVPIYFGQYGCYLAIIEIKTKENDVCECKLLKLEV